MPSSVKLKQHSVTLASIAAERRTKSTPSASDERPYVALEHIAADCGGLLGHDTTANATSDKTEFRKGDILFGKLRPYLRKCVQIGFDGVCSTDILVLHPKNGFDSRLLLHILRSEAVMRRAVTTAIGTKMPRTSWKALGECLITLPPEHLRQSTADVLDAIDEYIEGTRAMIDQNRKLKSALLNDLITKGLPGKRTQFHTVKLGDAFVPRKEAGEPGLPLVAVTMHNGLVARETIERRMETNLTHEQHLLVREDDIAYNMMRMWQGVFGRAHFDCLVSPAYVVVQPTGVISSSYAEYLFKHPATIHRFHLFSQGITDDRLRLYYEQFAPIRVRVPRSLDDQSKIVSLLNTLDSRSTSARKELEQLNATKAALSQSLLTGSVPQRRKGLE